MSKDNIDSPIKRKFLWRGRKKANKQPIDLGLFSISWRLIDDKKWRFHISGNWFRLSNTASGGVKHAIYRKICHVGNLSEWEILLDRHGWDALGGKEKKQDELNLTIDRLSRWETICYRFAIVRSHPSSSYRMTAYGLAFTLLAIGITIISIIHDLIGRCP